MEPTAPLRIQTEPDTSGHPHVVLTTPVAAGAWLADYRVTVRDGRLVVEEVRVYARGPVPPEGLTRRLLKSIPLAAPLAQADAQLRAFEAALERTLERSRLAPAASNAPAASKAVMARAVASTRATREMLSTPRARQAAQPAGAGPRGRPRLDDEEVLAAAVAYVHARAAGHRAPVQVAAKAAKMSEARMRDLVYRARRRQFLTRTTQGTGGGELTGAARALLRRRKGSKGRRAR